jgi:Ca2+-binding RTX toxin-like protein
VTSYLEIHHQQGSTAQSIVFEGGDGTDTVLGGMSLSPSTILYNGTWLDATGGGGADVLKGGEGDDIFRWGYGDGNDTIDGGNGVDTLIIDLEDGVSGSPEPVTLTQVGNEVIITVGSDSFSITAVEEIFITADTDGSAVSVNGSLSAAGVALNTLHFNGGPSADHFDGSGMTDNVRVVLDGAGGDDLLIGGNGNDTFMGGDGNDVKIGGPGTDTFIGTANHFVDSGGILDFEDGEKLIIQGHSNLAEIKDTKHGQATVHLDIDGDGLHDAQVNVRGNFAALESNRMTVEQIGNDTHITLQHLVAPAQILDGGSATGGDDNLYGSDFGDVLEGGDGNDIVDGNSGNDWLDGGGGGDVIRGEDGDDILSGGDGDDVVEGNSGNDIITLGAGADTLHGLPSGLYGDTVTDFTKEDAIQVGGHAIARDNISVTSGSAILGIDENGDGKEEGSFTLEGDFSSGDFMAVVDGTNTVITFHDFLPGLSDGMAVDPAQVNGVINELFLTGNGTKEFTIDLHDMGYAEYDSALGVYEIDGAGNILDTRLLFNSTNANKTATTTVSNVEDGNTLGFFIVQNAGSWASGLDPSDTFSFVTSGGAPANLSDGLDVLLAVNGVASNQ